jgi:uncharacterized membrane protein YtjA (UPF0391 family)
MLLFVLFGKIDGTPSASRPIPEGGVPVLYYALVFLIVGLVAGVLGATGVAVIASKIAWILFIVGIVLLVIHLATGRRGPVV